MEITQIAQGLGAVIAGFLAYLGIRHTIKGGERRQLRSEQEEADRLVRKYRDPLVRAAFDLQSRLYNIATNDFLGKYLVRGSPGEREYARESTLYVIAEFFGWIEILRREIQFLDLRDVGLNRELGEVLDEISRVFLAELPDPTLRSFRTEQRAIGEIMLASADGSGERECLGYATFVMRRESPDFSRWFGKLEADIELLAQEPGLHQDRLVRIQHVLIDLLGLLDPDHQFIPVHQRQKITAAEVR
jgi:hypothetical protein